MEKWTLNSVWYNFLSVLKNAETTATRGYVKQLINELCREAGRTRESLGIFAGVRASLYFQGDWTSVSFDAIGALAEKGTDVVFIEKEGIPEVLTEYADKYGVAMVNTRGYLTEYGKDLMVAAENSGAHIAIMTDYDITGIHITSHSPSNMPWIGVDNKTLEYFNLNPDDLAVEATNVRLFDNVKGLVRRDGRFKHVAIDFLKDQRIEIDAILSEVGGERLWGLIQEKLTKTYPTSDYNRAITLPAVESLYPKSIQDLLVYINLQASDVVSHEQTEIEESLEHVKGMIDIDKRKTEIFDQLNKVVENDNSMKLIAEKADQLLKALPKHEDSAN
jgi:hypothetical protein